MRGAQLRRRAAGCCGSRGRLGGGSAARRRVARTFKYLVTPKAGWGSLRPAEGFPLTPWAAEKMKTEKPTFSSDFRETTDPAVLYADPNGYPRIQMHPMKFKLVQTDDYVYHLWEYNQNWRQIAMNKEHSPDAPATWYGNAVGKWDGDTLVVDSTGFKASTWLPAGGPIRGLHIVGRIRGRRHAGLHSRSRSGAAPNPGRRGEVSAVERLEDATSNDLELTALRDGFVA